MDIHEEVEKRAQEMKLIEETAQRYGLSPQLLFASFKQETTTPPVTST